VDAAKLVRADLPSIATRGYDDTSVIHGIFGSACYITGERGRRGAWNLGVCCTRTHDPYRNAC
jgi:hypothetical protein